MTTVRDIINRLLPKGASTGPSENSDRCPEWPPDLFAVCATLLKLSGSYTNNQFSAAWDSKNCLFTREYRECVIAAAEKWRTSANPPNEVGLKWQDLIKADTANLSLSAAATKREWQKTALYLMAVADEASAGIGFVTARDSDRAFADWVLKQHLTYLEKGTCRLPNFPESLGIRVPKEEVCIQPKTLIPSVGYTLRSFAHHLALLPGTGDIATTWEIGIRGGVNQDQEGLISSHLPLNLLLVPLPFRIRGEAFECLWGPNRWGSLADPRSHGYFEVNPTWLPQGRDQEETAKIVASFLQKLVEDARREVSTVHGIVLPELALDRGLAEKVASRLATEEGLELFVTGVSAKGSQHPKNSVYACLFYNDEVYSYWHQDKHHRWLLEQNQITRYHLGHVLDPHGLWWEKISVEMRRCRFMAFRRNASLAVLICEDLARIDPVQTTIRAVGPNLLIALLMDGPQFKWRWPGRYATVLADDPGSAVLTLTSLGMVRRSAMPGEQERREIALWKEPGGQAIELQLPKGDHGLILTISSHFCQPRETIDGRSDEGMTVGLSLTGVRGVKAPPDVCQWLDGA